MDCYISTGKTGNMAAQKMYSNVHSINGILINLFQDFTIFPEEAEMKRVPQCTTGRVYLLRFKNNPQRKFFYWMQEPNEAKDADLIKKVSYKGVL